MISRPGPPENRRPRALLFTRSPEALGALIAERLAVAVTVWLVAFVMLRGAVLWLPANRPDFPGVPFVLSGHLWYLEAMSGSLRIY